MTLALRHYDFNFAIPVVDQALSDDAREFHRIKSIFSRYDSSISIGFSKEIIREELRDAINNASENDWDGYGASPPNQSAILYAMQFLDQLSTNLPPPEISVDTDGDIAIDWDYGPRKVISIRVGRDGTLNYAGLIGHVAFYGVEIFREGIPKTISTGIERVIGTP